MLTRLKVKGFKNLVDAEVRLGPLTCIAGPNGAGKSNLFDVIHFLSLLADKPFDAAARSVRGGEDFRDLFTRGGDGRIELQCDVIIPREGSDDFGQPAEASYTYLAYELALRYEEHRGALGAPRIVLEHEHLKCIAGEAVERLGFEASTSWLGSVIQGSARRWAFIDTSGTQAFLNQDPISDPEAKGGYVQTFEIARLPRTVLSSAQSAEHHPTAVLLRQELRQWRQLQLEPSALRQPDDFAGPKGMGAAGAGMAATLHRVASSSSDPEDVYAAVSNRVAELIDGVDEIRVDRDEGRRRFRLMMKDLHGVELPASSLSDGTLRFIALAVMDCDPTVQGLLCLEEPENGIHPQRVDAMLRLLAAMTVDPSQAADESNPLRQVAFSTHSPIVVGNMSMNDVVFATPVGHGVGGRSVRGLELQGLGGTWRAEPREGVAPGSVLAYLAASSSVADDEQAQLRVRDVMERERREIMLSLSRKVQ